VHRIIGGIKIEDDLTRWTLVRFKKNPSSGFYVGHFGHSGMRALRCL